VEPKEVEEDESEERNNSNDDDDENDNNNNTGNNNNNNNNHNNNNNSNNNNNNNNNKARCGLLRHLECRYRQENIIGGKEMVVCWGPEEDRFKIKEYDAICKKV
jgi:hypothetical protein